MILYDCLLLWRGYFLQEETCFSYFSDDYSRDEMKAVDKKSWDVTLCEYLNAN